MGFDITLSDPTGYDINDNGVFYMTFNHSKILTEYEIHPQDFVDKTVKEIIPMLNNAIMKMKENDINPNYSVLDTPVNNFTHKYMDDTFYAESTDVVMSIVMVLRTYLERFPNHFVWSYD
jgi:hypothetical protein